MLSGAALGNLPLHPFHEQRELFRLMVPFSLLAHFLNILRSISNTIRHEGRHLKDFLKNEGIA